MQDALCAAVKQNRDMEILMDGIWTPKWKEDLHSRFLRQTQGLFVLEQVIRHPMKFVIDCSASANTSITDNELWDFVRKKPEISSNNLE